MPPITAATIATIAIGAGRSRTRRTVAALVLDVRAENPLEQLLTPNCAEPGSQQIGGIQRVLTLSDPHPHGLSTDSIAIGPVNDSAPECRREAADWFLVSHPYGQA